MSITEVGSPTGDLRPSPVSWLGTPLDDLHSATSALQPKGSVLVASEPEQRRAFAQASISLLGRQ